MEYFKQIFSTRRNKVSAKYSYFMFSYYPSYNIYDLIRKKMMANAGVDLGEGNTYSLLVGVKTDRVSK